MSKLTHFGARLRLRVLKLAAVIGAASAIAIPAEVITAGPAEAKTPGARYCFARACHRVLTLEQTQAAVGKPVMAVTSFYDDCRRDPYNPCGLTSSGEVFRPGESNSAASPIYPDGTVVLVRNPTNGESAIVRINNAGPYWGNRTLDLSRAAGFKLGLGRVGVAKVEVTVLRAPTRREATYRKGRRYPALPGHVGRFASLSEAQVFAAVQLDLPDAMGAGVVSVAQIDPQAIPAQPVTYAPPTGPKPERRLPAEAVRVLAQGDDAVATPAVLRAYTIADAGPVAAPGVTSLAAPVVEISGAALLVPAAGETTRVISPRASIVSALRAQDFDRRGRSLLDPVAAGEAPGLKQKQGRAVASLAAVSEQDTSLGGVETLKLERMPPLATRGERGWYRRSTVAVSHVVAFAPAGVAQGPMRLARWAALHDASFKRLQPTRAVRADPRSTVASLRSLWREGDDLQRLARAPARARINDMAGLIAA